ncbi:MAG: VOC family protein [Thermoleophilia bacterium]
MITRVRFASLAVGDIDVSYDFYVNKLGFQPQVDTPLPDGNTFMLQEGGFLEVPAEVTGSVT